MVARNQPLKALAAGLCAVAALVSFGCNEGVPSAIATPDVSAARAHWAQARVEAIAQAGGGALKPLDVAASPITVQPRVLMYHDIVASGAIGDRVDVGRFEAQMDYLRQAGYVSVSAEDYYDAYRGHKPLPLKAVLITFDDSDSGQYRYAAPILKARGLKATFFVLPGVVGRPGHLTWAQMSALDRMPGFRLYSHTNLHDLLPTLKLPERERELRDSRLALERHLGGRRDFFAYPNGAYDLAVMALTERYYKMAFAVGGTTVPGVAPHLQVPRIGIGADVTTIDQFVGRLEGHRVVSADPADMREAIALLPVPGASPAAVKVKQGAKKGAGRRARKPVKAVRRHSRH